MIYTCYTGICVTSNDKGSFVIDPDILVERTVSHLENEMITAVLCGDFTSPSQRKTTSTQLEEGILSLGEDFLSEKEKEILKNKHAKNSDIEAIARRIVNHLLTYELKDECIYTIV